ncbi:MAG: hypothetical protein EPN17_17180 [Methylobacter sp.]|nr:MAG: hypothetical protein EPN17_17180 [Methylobacter sp.]
MALKLMTLAGAELLIFPLRYMNALALLIHGFGHGLMLFLVTGEAKSFALNTLTEGLGVADVLKSLCPFQPLPQFSSNPPIIPHNRSTSMHCRLVAIGGIAMNMLSIALVLWGYAQIPHSGFWLYPLLPVYFILSSCMAMLSLPDIAGLIKGQAAFFACGPAFAIRYKLNEEEKNIPGLATDRLLDLVEILSREAATRGGQSGGFSFIAKKAEALSIIFDKVVKGKREDIVRVLCERLYSLLRKAKKEGYTKAGDFEAVLLHLRYATGGATHWHNAQPHWYEHYENMTHHRIENGSLVNTEREVFNMIAHNGDMDGVYLEFTIDGKRVRHLFTQMEARTIFLTMMPHSTSQGNSDSRSVAEWMDFHHTQGLAYKALRYAYFTSVLDFNKDIVAGQFNLTSLHHWAEVVDSAIISGAGSVDGDSLSADAQSIDDLHESIKNRVRVDLAAELALTLPEEKVERFIVAFEDAFYRHDLTWVMRQASRNLVGEFALMVCTTMEPRIGVFSLTQAFSIGHNYSRGEIFGSAEPQGVTSSLHSGEANDEALQINLEDGQYAIIEFSGAYNKQPITIYERALDGDDYTKRAQPALKAIPRSGRADCAWFPVNGNAKIERSTRRDTPGEEIRRDISEIPYILKRIVESFKPGGENVPTMANFCQCLFDNLLDPQRDSRKFDLVLFGVDFNQDLIAEFALALKSLLPGLSIRAENSGNVLKEMKRTRREGIGGYGKNTVFLGVSNSAQTQSTLAALRKSVELVGPERCFVLTQSFLNSMSQALGQSYDPKDPTLPHTFVNLSHLSPDSTSGRRRSEAATIVPVATQAVLTEILVNMTQFALEERHFKTGDRHIEVRHDLQVSDLLAFRQFQAAVYGVEIPNRVGFNAAGQAIDSPDSDAIEREAVARAENTIEFVRSYAVFAAYIVVATLFGVPVFSVLSSPLQFITGVNFVAHVLDAALFLSALWLIHLGFRCWQGRPVFERIGARAELYIDRKYIARMVERYNATLFSNAPAFLTPFFYWADTVRDALHRYGIRAHRGVVTIHRTPDERMGVEEANNAAEENMVFAQIGGIRFNAGQPQSRDKVRSNSKYMNRTAQDRAARPFQIVLSDSLEGLRQQYDQKLSPEVLRLINRRLIDLSDGLIFEFVVGNQRKDIVNQAVWDVIKWLPGANWIYHLALNYGVDLKCIIGDADTANQAQIQSTKHPVSPIDIGTETMQPKPTIDALISKQQSLNEQAFAILVFFENRIAINLHGNQDSPNNAAYAREILLRPGKFKEKGKLVNAVANDKTGKYQGVLRRIGDHEYLEISHDNDPQPISIPFAALTQEQQSFLKRQLGVTSMEALQIAA